MTAARRIAVLSLGLLVGAGCQAGPTEADWPPLPPNFSQVDYEVIERVHTAYSGLVEQRRQVITTVEEWAAFWEEFEATREPKTELPAVDFTTHVVLIAAMGSRGTGGYTISIEAVFEADDRLLVRVLERSPGSNCIVTQAVTRPTTGVVVPRHTTDVTFQEKAETVDCS